MRKSKILFYLLTILLLLSCKQDIVKKNSPRSVFEVFWQVMDERYVYFEEKNLNWDSIYNTYYPKINDHTTDEELKSYFQEIINYIKDGHVSITYDIGKVISYKYHNYSDDNYKILTSRQFYKDFEKGNGIGKGSSMAQVGNSILYIQIYSFNYEPHLEDLFEHIDEYNYQDGIIVDLSWNTGGFRDNLREWTSLFFEGTETFLYTKNKTGKAHTNFSDYKPIDFEGQGYFKNNTPIVLITGGLVYSAGSSFSAIMKELPNCKVFGEATSGGGGSTTYIMLPNNWSLRYSYEKRYDLNKYSLEKGVQPDTVVIGTVFTNEEGSKIADDKVMDACINYLKTYSKNTN